MDDVGSSAPDGKPGARLGHRITVIDGGWPPMFPPTSDGGHRVMRWTPALAGNVPRRGLIRWAGEVLGLRQAGRADLNRALRRNINSARGYERPVDMAIRRMPSQH